MSINDPSDHSLNRGPGRERWLVSYADFITLLFAFFVVLFAASNQNLEKLQKFQESVRKNMGLTTGVILSGGYGALSGESGATGRQEDQTASGGSIPARQAAINTGLPALKLDPKEMEEALYELLERHTGRRSSPFLGAIRQASDSLGRSGLSITLEKTLFLRPSQMATQEPGQSNNGQTPNSADLGFRLNSEASGALMALGEWVRKLELQARLITHQDLDSPDLLSTQESLNLLGKYFLKVHQWGSQLEAIEWSVQNLHDNKPGIFVTGNEVKY
jgi:flagellar motor protein MotB